MEVIAHWHKIATIRGYSALARYMQWHGMYDSELLEVDRPPSFPESPYSYSSAVSVEMWAEDPSSGYSKSVVRVERAHAVYDVYEVFPVDNEAIGTYLVD